MKIDELDFSEFHPLDHNIFDVECPKFYGGIPRHIYLWWEYQASKWLWLNILCGIRIHSFTEFHNNKDEKWIACRYCWKHK